MSYTTKFDVNYLFYFDQSGISRNLLSLIYKNVIALFLLH